MSWLKDRLIQYLYRDAETSDEMILELLSSEDAPKTYDGYSLIEMLPYQVNLTFKVQFERNGTVGYKYDQGNGKIRTVSATRENYEKNMGSIGGDKIREMKKNGTLSELSKSVTTKGYKDTFLSKVYNKRKVK